MQHDIILIYIDSSPGQGEKESKIMESENQRLIDEIKRKSEDIYADKVSPFRDQSTQRQASEIQKKIKAEEQAQHYEEDRYDRITDKDFFQKHGMDIPDSLNKGEERAKQKAELKALKDKIKSKLEESGTIEHEQIVNPHSK